MKDLLASLITEYNSYRGTGKGLPLFLVSVLIIYLINISRKDIDDKGGTVNPLLFILSPVSGIGYACSLAYEAYLCKEESSAGRIRTVLSGALMGSAVMLSLILSGKLVFTAARDGKLLPLVLVPVYLAVYALVAGKLFSDKRLKWFMVLCILVLGLWGYQSDELLPVTMFYGRFSFPAVMVHGILPIVLLFAIDKYPKIAEVLSGEGDISREELDYYEWEEEDMKNHKIINSRNLAIALLIVVIMLLGSVFVMNRKINNLYETTVNLQNEVERLQQ